MQPPAIAQPFVPRPTRFDLRVPLCYRARGAEAWSRGTMQNVSRSGLLFRPEVCLEIGTIVELMFELPDTGTAGSAARVICQGQVVRTAAADDGPPAMAVAIKHYKFRRSAQVAEEGEAVEAHSRLRGS